MPPTIPRRTALRATLGLGLGALLRPAQACEYFGLNLRITHPWTRASAADADSALVCMRFDEVTRNERLVQALTPVATAVDLVTPDGSGALDLAIPAGEETLLTEAGTHLRLRGLRQPLEVGRSYPLVLVFAHGGPVSATLNIDYARFG